MSKNAAPHLIGADGGDNMLLNLYTVEGRSLLVKGIHKLNNEDKYFVYVHSSGAMNDSLIVPGKFIKKQYVYWVEKGSRGIIILDSSQRFLIGTHGLLVPSKVSQAIDSAREAYRAAIKLLDTSIE